MKEKNQENKGMRKLTEEELKEVTGGEISPSPRACVGVCINPGQHFDFKTCKCVD